jgi:hypothetical protein
MPSGGEIRFYVAAPHAGAQALISNYFETGGAFTGDAAIITGFNIAGGYIWVKGYTNTNCNSACTLKMVGKSKAIPGDNNYTVVMVDTPGTDGKIFADSTTAGA